MLRRSQFKASPGDLSCAPAIIITNIGKMDKYAQRICRIKPNEAPAIMRNGSMLERNAINVATISANGTPTINNSQMNIIKGSMGENVSILLSKLNQ